MPERFATSLGDAASATFESLAYVWTERAVEESTVPGSAEGVVAVSFRGSTYGAVILQLSGDILPTLTANMLGVDDGVSLADQRDALGETANVICGNVLPRVAGQAAVFTLDVPRHHTSWASAVQALGAVSAQVRLDLEGGRADVALIVHPAA